MQSTNYYKYKLLEIHHKRGVAYIPLTRERGYFYETPYDSDEENYHEKVREYQARVLETPFRPILIFHNTCGFIRPLHQEKYERYVVQKMRQHQQPSDQDQYFTAWKDTGTIYDWDDIIDIYKIEKREMKKNFTVSNPYINHIETKRLEQHKRIGSQKIQY